MESVRIFTEENISGAWHGNYILQQNQLYGASKQIPNTPKPTHAHTICGTE